MTYSPLAAGRLRRCGSVIYSIGTELFEIGLFSFTGVHDTSGGGTFLFFIVFAPCRDLSIIYVRIGGYLRESTCDYWVH